MLAAYRAWSGSFGAFCEHVRRELRVELGDTLIAGVLFEHGERTPAKRPGRSRDEHALRGAFETFFPGAQWVADGKTLEILIDGETWRVNLELAVDAATGAAVGVDVSDEEDGQAVRAVYASGVETTGAPPLAMLLDNKPSNHTSEVDAALGDTMRIRATEYRPQNKAHCEGAFGLFAQKVPPIELDTRDPRALAKTIAKVVAIVFFRALNRAPRRDRDGKTRADLYAQSVTPEQREAEEQSTFLAARIRENVGCFPAPERAALTCALDRLLEDERRHVALARGFLEQIGAPAPGAAPVISPGTDEPSDLFVFRCVLTGLAVCETVSAMRFATVRQHTDLAVPRACIDTLLRDEVAHARLGFLLLPMVLDRRAAEIGREAVLDEARAELRSTFRHLDVEVGLDADRRGITLARRPQPPMNPGVVEPALDALSLRQAIRCAVIPRLARLGIDAARVWDARWE